MRAVVIGLGSMGRRRIRLIQQIDSKIEIIGVDTAIDRQKQVEDHFRIKTVGNLNDITMSVDCALISTSPLSHASLIRQCLERGWHTFTEINLVDDGYDENIALAKSKNLVLFLSSTPIYREEMKYVIRKVKEHRDAPVNYIYHIGQYLPDWHPWESYKNFFVGDRRTNGCREIMAIELPWMSLAFGEIESVTALSDNITKLDIDYKDNYLILLRHKNGNKGVLVVDVVARKAVRKLEVISEELYLNWDGSPDSLFEYDFESKDLHNIKLYVEVDQQEGYSSFVVENAYKNEILSFFDQIANGTVPLYGFEQDKAILKLIDKIEA